MFLACFRRVESFSILHRTREIGEWKDGLFWHADCRWFGEGGQDDEGGKDNAMETTTERQHKTLNFIIDI